jgi:hypothetical protein
MGKPNLISKDLTISATPEVWRKLERFFAAAWLYVVACTPISLQL